MNSVLAGNAFPHDASGSVSLALDSNGTPGVAFVEESGNDYMSFRVLYWRPGMTNAVVAYDFGNPDTDVNVSLAFAGTSPRIAGQMVGSATSDRLTFLSSSDGTTWNPPVFLPNGGTDFDSAIAADGMGHVAIAGDSNGATPNCGGNPYLALSPNDGMTWNAACPDNTGMAGYTGESMNAVYGASRIRGKLTLSFVNRGIGATAPQQPGIIYYQQP
jgi:hypothetical protein